MKLEGGSRNQRGVDQAPFGAGDSFEFRDIEGRGQLQ
jgi:hypothetical protein